MFKANISDNIFAYGRKSLCNLRFLMPSKSCDTRLIYLKLLNF